VWWAARGPGGAGGCVPVAARTASPVASSLLFGYVATYLYDGDAPLAERRAHALSVDQSQLRDLIGDTELRDLLDESVLDALEQEPQHLPERIHARPTHAVHDLLFLHADLRRVQIAALCRTGAATPDIHDAHQVGRGDAAGPDHV